MPFWSPSPQHGLRTSILVAAAACSPLALASPDAQPVRFEVDAPSGCADADEFAGQVRLRTDKTSPPREGEDRRGPGSSGSPAANG